MNESTKNVIELLTGLASTQVVSRTKIYKPSQMKDLFYKVFVGEIKPDIIFESFDIKEKEIFWGQVFEEIVMKNIIVDAIEVFDTLSPDLSINLHVTIRVNTDV